MKKVKLNIYLEPSQKQALYKLSAETGAPVAELIRRFIAAGLKRKGQK